MKPTKEQKKKVGKREGESEKKRPPMKTIGIFIFAVIANGAAGYRDWMGEWNCSCVGFDSD